MTITSEEVMHAPSHYEEHQKGQLGLLFDPESPNWIATNAIGLEIFRWVNGKHKMSDLVGRYQSYTGKDWPESWLHVRSFVNQAMRYGFLRTAPFPKDVYPGRGKLISNHQLKEVWLHLTNRCNLTCAHCIVNSSPKGIEGLSTERWLRTIIDAKEMGASRFYITGGEPFIRRDLLDLIEAICVDSQLTVLTNAMFFRNTDLKKLKAVGRENLSFQISIDGPDLETHNAIRGSGFERTIEGVRLLLDEGFQPTVSTVLTRSNIHSLSSFPEFLDKLNIRHHHLLWDHMQGRALDHKEMQTPSSDEIIDGLEAYLEKASSRGIQLDNYQTALERVQGRPGVKTDLSGAGTNSCCVYADGMIYPSPALVNVPQLCMGDIEQDSLKEIWRNSSHVSVLRQASVVDKNECKECYLKYICGGGDIDHSFYYSGNVLGEDPFSRVHEWLLIRAIEETVTQNRLHTDTGQQVSPYIVAAMGESLSQMDTIKIDNFEIMTSRSTCVLSLNAAQSRSQVQTFYSKAALEPQQALCCPTAYDGTDLEILPKEVTEVSYGCGSPIQFAHITEGETYVDLGSGGGIDCFIAAQKVGPSGHVIGIDMTTEMLKRADRNRSVVAKTLGYDVVEFQQGYLEALELEDQTADIVTSNCVINLSPDKRRVISEVWRILKNHGRAIISDTVSESKIPQNMKANPTLWGECVSGALTEDEYFSLLEEVGFYGISLIEKRLWKEIDGFRFYSVIIKGFKFSKNQVCNFEGTQALYLGPLKAVIDEEGHLFPRNEPVEICSDTAAKLSLPPYSGSFLVFEQNNKEKVSSICCDTDKCC